MSLPSTSATRSSLEPSSHGPELDLLHAPPLPAQNGDHVSEGVNVVDKFPLELVEKFTYELRKSATILKRCRLVSIMWNAAATPLLDFCLELHKGKDIEQALHEPSDRLLLVSSVLLNMRYLHEWQGAILLSETSTPSPASSPGPIFQDESESESMSDRYMNIFEELPSTSTSHPPLSPGPYVPIESRPVQYENLARLFKELSSLRSITWLFPSINNNTREKMVSGKIVPFLDALSTLAPHLHSLRITADAFLYGNILSDVVLEANPRELIVIKPIPSLSSTFEVVATDGVPEQGLAGSMVSMQELSVPVNEESLLGCLSLFLGPSSFSPQILSLEAHDVCGVENKVLNALFHKHLHLAKLERLAISLNIPVKDVDIYDLYDDVMESNSWSLKSLEDIPPMPALQHLTFGLLETNRDETIEWFSQFLKKFRSLVSLRVLRVRIFLLDLDPDDLEDWFTIISQEHWKDIVKHLSLKCPALREVTLTLAMEEGTQVSWESQGHTDTSSEENLTYSNEYLWELCPDAKEEKLRSLKRLSEDFLQGHFSAAGRSDISISFEREFVAWDILESLELVENDEDYRFTVADCIGGSDYADF